MYVLITPAPNTARSLFGHVMSGGRHYLLVEKTNVFVRNGLAQGNFVLLEGFEHNGAFITKNAIDQMVQELAKSRKQEENETYEEYRGNLYRFAVEALAAEQEGTDEANAEDEKPASKKRTSTKSAAPKDTGTADAAATDPADKGN